MVSSSVQSGGGWAARAANMPFIFSELLLLLQMCRAGRGSHECMGCPPHLQFMGTSVLGHWRSQGSSRGENQPKLLVANLSLPGLSLGQRTPSPAGESSQGSWVPMSHFSPWKSVGEEVGALGFQSDADETWKGS